MDFDEIRKDRPVWANGQHGIHRYAIFTLNHRGICRWWTVTTHTVTQSWKSRVLNYRFSAPSTRPPLHYSPIYSPPSPTAPSNTSSIWKKRRGTRSSGPGMHMCRQSIFHRSAPVCFRDPALCYAMLKCVMSSPIIWHCIIVCVCVCSCVCSCVCVCEGGGGGRHA
jgi:hypothetical protein